MSNVSPFSQHLKFWRAQRGWSQLTLAVRADTTQRHVSFLETGRSRPGEEMILRLCHALELGLRERNEMLSLAGFAPLYPELAPQSQETAFFYASLERMLRAHEPYPALVLDGRWTLRASNAGARRLFPTLFEGANLARAIFGEEGALRAQLENWEDVARTAFERLRREALMAPSDPMLQDLMREARAQMELADVEAWNPTSHELVLCPHIRTPLGSLKLFSMVATFAAAQEVGLAELRVELLFPSDPDSEALLQQR